MAEWATLPSDILVLIAERIDFFEDFINFCVVCKSWQSVTSILGKSRILPPRFPWVMLTDIAEKNYPKEVTGDMLSSRMLVEEVKKNEYIEGMHNRRFLSFSTSKTYEFELPEATRRKCLGVSYGWLLTIGFDLQINLLHPFTRLQIGMPPLLSFKSLENQDYYEEDFNPQAFVDYFVNKAVMSSNPHNTSNEDCIVLVIYGGCRVLAFARPGDEVWTDINVPSKVYTDVVYYKGKFYAVDYRGVVVVCDINDVNGPKATPIARIPDGFHVLSYKYLVESLGFLLLVIRCRRGVYYGDKEDVDRPYHHYTTGFSIFRLEECNGDVSSHKYPYKMTQLDSLGDNTLFVGYNASSSLPSSKCVKANCIYFSDDNVETFSSQGGGHDMGIFDVESGSITLHYASKFMSHLTPPIWFI